MPTSTEMIDHLASNIINPIPIWKITSRDGLIAAYAAHTRSTVGRQINQAPPFIFESTTYKIAPVQTTRDMQKIGLQPQSTEIHGVFDDVITRADVEGGRWNLAKVVYQYVNYLDLSMGATGKIAGVTGKWTPMGVTYQVEILSNASLLAQQIGELVSITDRAPFPIGLNKAAWTITRNVVSSVDRRHFVVDGTLLADDYYKYGVAKCTTGANSTYPGMEIKGNVGNTIELFLPMPANWSAGNVVTLLAGYDGTREQARDKFNNMINFNGESDLPGLKVLYTYPE
jgi:uncharacterized phage protein (TIGR02218 family)